jgi:hypothetical protein
MRIINKAMLILLLGMFALGAQAKDIIHDAEYYIVEAQNGERWTAEDKELDARLAELKKRAWESTKHRIHFVG